MSTYESVEEFTLEHTAITAKRKIKLKLNSNLNEVLEKGLCRCISYRETLYKLTAIFPLIFLQMPFLSMSAASEISR